MKHGLTTQPFLFLLTLITMALIITFGTKSILDLKRTADFTELTTFINQLKEQTSLMENFDTGSTKTITLTLPPTIKAFCIHNPDKPINTPIQDAFFKNILEQATHDNVYLLPLDAFPKTTFTIEPLIPGGTQNPQCTPTNGRLTTTLQTTLINNEITVTLKP